MDITGEIVLVIDETINLRSFCFDIVTYFTINVSEVPLEYLYLFQDVRLKVGKTISPAVSFYLCCLALRQCVQTKLRKARNVIMVAECYFDYDSAFYLFKCLGLKLCIIIFYYCFYLYPYRWG